MRGSATVLRVAVAVSLLGAHLLCEAFISLPLWSSGGAAAASPSRPGSSSSKSYSPPPSILQVTSNLAASVPFVAGTTGTYQLDGDAFGCPRYRKRADDDTDNSDLPAAGGEDSGSSSAAATAAAATADAPAAGPGAAATGTARFLYRSGSTGVWSFTGQEANVGLNKASVVSAEGGAAHPTGLSYRYYSAHASASAGDKAEAKWVADPSFRVTAVLAADAATGTGTSTGCKANDAGSAAPPQAAATAADPIASATPAAPSAAAAPAARPVARGPRLRVLQALEDPSAGLVLVAAGLGFLLLWCHFFGPNVEPASAQEEKRRRQRPPPLACGEHGSGGGSGDRKADAASTAALLTWWRRCWMNGSGGSGDCNSDSGPAAESAASRRRPPDPVSPSSSAAVGGGSNGGGARRSRGDLEVECGLELRVADEAARDRVLAGVGRVGRASSAAAVRYNEADLRWLHHAMGAAAVAALPELIVLVRHGESEGNADHSLYRTKPDNHIELTARGSAQALKVGERIKRIVGDRNVAIHVSPFERTMQTARNIRKVLGEAQIKTTRVDARLREQEFGNLQDEDFHLLRKQQQTVGRFWFRFPTGESGADVYGRTRCWWNDAVASVNQWNCFESDDDEEAEAEEKASSGGCVDRRRVEALVVVTHGLTMRFVLMQLFHWSPTSFHTVWNAGNCGIYVLRKASGTSLTPSSPSSSTSPSSSRCLGSLHSPYVMDEVAGDRLKSSLEVQVELRGGEKRKLTLEDYIHVPSPRTRQFGVVRRMLAEQHDLADGDIVRVDFAGGRFHKFR